MKRSVTVKVIEDVEYYNRDLTVLLAEVKEGEIIVADLYEETGEFFGSDSEGREIYVGQMDIDDSLILAEEFSVVA